MWQNPKIMFLYPPLPPLGSGHCTAVCISASLEGSRSVGDSSQFESVARLAAVFPNSLSSLRRHVLAGLRLAALGYLVLREDGGGPVLRAGSRVRWTTSNFKCSTCGVTRV